MGLYDSKAVSSGFKFGFAWKQLKHPALGIAVVIIALVALFLVILPALQAQPLDAALQPNPLDLTKGQNSFLTVAVNNTTGATAKNVVIEVSTEASDAITIFPASKAIETLGKGENRVLEDAFVISPNPAKKVPALEKDQR